MLSGDNLLILDEPTNHLDIQGKEALEKALENFDGTMIFVSHDRYFIDKLASDVFVIQDGIIRHEARSIQEIAHEEKKAVNEKKETSKEAYQQIKRIKNRQQKIELLLPDLHEQLELHRELRFDEDYYHDPQKMDNLNQEIDAIHVEIKQLEDEWTENALILEEQSNNE
ncbi:hypothetical protein [Erysipelothrix sp. HDW6A]|uniref:hypothetical protein n=1 Tax=Erysipelothrix sp. HDW6A TaxID=2714928 RepID=UPI00351AE61A